MGADAAARGGPGRSTVQVQLSRDEAVLLAELLRADLAALRSEVFHTEDYELRQELKRREASIVALIGRIDAEIESADDDGGAVRGRERLIVVSVAHHA